MAERERVDTDGRLALVSIITINYNQAEITRQFLESTKLLTYPNYELIVVDNASDIPLSTAIDSTAYPHLTLIRSEINRGFTGGNNLGIQHAKGDFLFIVNNDTELSAGLLEALLQPFTMNPQVGVTCPKIRFFDPPQLLQYAGYNPINMFTGQATAIGFKQPDTGQFDRPHTTYFAHGCAMMVSREVVEKVGRFAERFFLYYEELDWSQRIRDAGYLIYYQPSASILHKESVSVGQNSPMRTYYLTRNRILFMRRHCSWFQRVVFFLFFSLFVLPKHVLAYVISGQLEHAKAFLQGSFWHFTASSVSPV